MKLYSSLSRLNGISESAAEVLVNLSHAEEVESLESFDEEGREALFWLIHRGFVNTTDHLGVMYAHVSPYGRTAIENARRSNPRPAPHLAAPGVHTTNG